MNNPAYLPPSPLGWTEHERVTLTPATYLAEALPTRTRYGAFAPDGSVIEGFRFRRGDGLSLIEDEPPPSGTSTRLAGTYLYGGILEFQYGGFLTETLTRAWLLRRHPGLPILLHAYGNRMNLASWQREVLAMLGIPEGRCRFVTEPVTVDRVLLADPGCVLERWLDPVQARALGVFPSAERARPGRRVWLSRSRLREGLAQVQGEAELEALLAASGWTVLHPQTLPVWQQLAFLSDAEAISGFEGSAFHTLLLAEDVKARINLYARSSGRWPAMHRIIATAKHLRQDERELPLRHVEGGGRKEVVALPDPAAAARSIDAEASIGEGGIALPRPSALVREPADPLAPPAPFAAKVPPQSPPLVRGKVDASTPVAFIHIPKSGGTSFTQALRHGWPEARIVATQSAFDEIPIDELQQLDLVAGHFFAYRLEQRTPGLFSPVTLLRDPFDRLFSAYRFGRQFARSGATVGPAMRLAGQVDFGAWTEASFGATQGHAQLYQLGLNHGDRAASVSLERLLEQAKARLAGMLVGTTDRLADFVALVYRTHGRGDPPQVEHAMPTRERYTPEEAGLTTEQRDALMERLRPDYALFAHARDVMHRQLDAA